MNPILKLWMFHSWCQDQVDKNEFAKSFSIFLGSFFNPEAASKMLDDDQIASSEEDFEESLRWIEEGIPGREPKEENLTRRQRRKKKRERKKVIQ